MTLCVMIAHVRLTPCTRATPYTHMHVHTLMHARTHQCTQTHTHTSRECALPQFDAFIIVVNLFLQNDSLAGHAQL